MFSRDLPASTALPAALDWIEDLLLGPLATSVAVISVAGVGFLMLTGRFDVRRAARVVLGCFLIFGASAISAGLQSAITAAASQSNTTPPPLPLPSPVEVRGSSASAYDPYAGVTIPR